MIHGLLPMSLVPKATLTAILEEIHGAQAQSTDRRSLALTLDNILRYHEKPLVQRVQSGLHGLFITVKVPLTSRDRVLDVYEGVPLPMPTDDNRTATLSNTETRYIAVSTNQQENALLTPDQLAACVGPPDQAVCQEGFATTSDWSTCMATLFMHPAHMAIHACDITTIQLPEVEQATNLQHGRWLITSQKPDFTLRIVPDGGGSSTIRGTNRQLSGCRACIITLACGTVVETDNLLLAADASSCNATGARRLDLNISAPLATLFSYVPLTAGSAEEYEALTARRVHLFREVKARLPPVTDLPAPSLDRLRLIAEPIAYTSAVPSDLDINFAVSRGWWTEVVNAAALAAALNFSPPARPHTPAQMAPRATSQV